MNTRNRNNAIALEAALIAEGFTAKAAEREARKIVGRRIALERGKTRPSDWIVRCLNRCTAYSLADYARIIAWHTGARLTVGQVAALMARTAKAGRVQYAIVGGTVYGAALSA